MAKVRWWRLSGLGRTLLWLVLGLHPRCCCCLSLLLWAGHLSEVFWWRLGRSLVRLGLGMNPRFCCWSLLLLAHVLSELCWWRLGLRCFGLLEVPSGLRPVLSHRLVVLGRQLLHWWVGGLGPGLGLGGWCFESCWRQASWCLRRGFGATVGQSRWGGLLVALSVAAKSVL